MKRPFSFVAGTAAAVVSLCASLPAFALEGTLKRIKDSGSITVGHRDASIPFSYYDGKRRVVGYSIDLCMRIVDAARAELKMPRLDVRYQLVTSANRIPLMANGTIDLECGSTSNNFERQKQVAFTITHFVTANRWIAKKTSNIKSIQDLKGKTVVSTAGTTNIRQITEINAAKNLGMEIIAANGHPEAFQMMDSGRAVAFVMDDILLYGLAAQARNPSDYVISAEPLSVEPYGIMLRKDDPAFKKLADDVMIKLYRSGEIAAIYDRWFQSPVPPKGINLNVPMSTQLKKVVANPTDSGDPAVYR
jgi:glutamate/aspartate transport system substrate-binding protein